MPAKKDPTAPKSPAKPRAKAKPKAEALAAPVTPKKAATRSRAKRPVADAVAVDAAAETVAATREPVSSEPTVIDALPANTAELFSDTSSSREAQIRLRAYLIYAERGYRPGSPESDWFQAEQEVAYGRRV